MRTEAIQRFVQTQILNDASVEIDPDQNLLLTDVLDSLGVVQLIEWLETEYSVTIPPEDVTLENFATLRLIDAYVSTRES